MKKRLLFHGKEVAVTLSESAVTESLKLAQALLLEVQIYFSCVLVKRVAIYSGTVQEGAWQLEQEQFTSILKEAQAVSGKLFVRFNTVMTQSCPVSTHTGPPPISDFKIERAEAFVPRWLEIDYAEGEWLGDYGWQSDRERSVTPLQIRAGS